jgi:hypothetical protein
MRKATLKVDEPYPEAQPIVEALFRLGIEISRKDAYEAWSKFSESMAAGWMNLPEEDGEILGEIRQYLDIEDEDGCLACLAGGENGATYFRNAIKHTCR